MYDVFAIVLIGRFDLRMTYSEHMAHFVITDLDVTNGHPVDKLIHPVLGHNGLNFKRQANIGLGVFLDINKELK